MFSGLASSHRDAVCCGSLSTTPIFWPRDAKAKALLIIAVVFPEPHFWFKNAIRIVWELVDSILAGFVRSPNPSTLPPSQTVILLHSQVVILWVSQPGKLPSPQLHGFTGCHVVGL